MTTYGQSLLFIGEGALEEALQVGSKGDLYRFRPEGKLALHSADTLRELTRLVFLSPHQEHQTFILEEADRMWPVSANSLLKTLEEPPRFSTLILTTHYPDRILPTILSRCQKYHFGASATSKKRLTPEFEKGRPQHYQDAVALAKQIADELETERETQEAQALEELAQSYPKETTAFQREEIEKQALGIASRYFRAEAHALFDEILQLRRQQVQKMALPDPEPLAQALSLVTKSRLSLERSTPLSFILEHLLWP